MRIMETPFISFLIERGKISKESWEKVLSSIWPIENTPIEECLVSSGILTEEEFRSNLEKFFEVPFAAKDDFPQEPLLINNLSLQFMKESKFIPARLIDKELTVIMSNPLDYYVMDAIRLATGQEVRPLIGNR